jgi:hypothetical protein
VTAVLLVILVLLPALLAMADFGISDGGGFGGF